MHPINQGIIDEWILRRNFGLRIVCIKAVLDELFIDFRVIFCCWFTSYIWLFFVIVLDSVMFEKIL